MAADKLYTRAGDDGTTGLLYGGRVRKDSQGPVAYGSVDEAQAFLGLARCAVDPSSAAGGEIDRILVGVESDLWVLMAELATDPHNRSKLVDDKTRVSARMVTALEELIDDVSGRYEPSREFVVPGQDLLSAHLDVARTVVRRAERDSLVAAGEDSHALAYLNRLSDLLFALARWAEGDETLAARQARDSQGGDR